MSKIKCKIQVGSKRFTKTLKSLDWDENYKVIVDLCNKKTKKEYGKDFHIEIENETITSKEIFVSVLKKNIDKESISIVVKVSFVLFVFLRLLTLSLCNVLLFS